MSLSEALAIHQTNKMLAFMLSPFFSAIIWIHQMLAVMLFSSTQLSFAYEIPLCDTDNQTWFAAFIHKNRECNYNILRLQCQFLVLLQIYSLLGGFSISRFFLDYLSALQSKESPFTQIDINCVMRAREGSARPSCHHIVIRNRNNSLCERAMLLSAM